MSQQKQQNEPSGAAKELTKQLNRAGNLYWLRILFDCETNEVEARFAAAIDAAMQPEREAANGLKEYILNNTSCDCTPISYRPCNRCKALAAYEAARGK